MTTRKISFSLSEDTLNLIDTRSDGNRSAAITQITSLYDAIMRQEKRALAGTFTAQECGLILDALNGAYLADETSRAYAWHTILDAIEEDSLHDKWRVDPQQIAEKLQALDFAAHVAMCDAVASWWSRAAAGERPYGELFDTPRPARPIRVQP